MIYLDNAATTLIKPASVERSVVEALRSMASPGRGGHAPAMKAAETVFDCRCAAAELFNADAPEQIVFTMNATHALNIAIDSSARKGSKVLVSGFEHNSAVRPLYAMGADVTVAGTKLFDRADTLRDFERKINGKNLVVCTHVSNVFGYILPIYEIAELCRKKGVPLIVDASQSAGVIDVDFKRLGAQFVAMPGHKALFGPQGTGILICRDGGSPLMHGGSGTDSRLKYMPEYMPDRLEAGTHNVCGIAGLLSGIRYVQSRGTDKIFQQEKNLLDVAKRELQMVENTEIFTGNEQSGVISLRIGGLDSEEAAQRLGNMGICVRSGLHCSPLAHRSAGTLDTGTVRLSFSAFTNEKHVRDACRAIKEICNNKG